MSATALVLLPSKMNKHRDLMELLLDLLHLGKVLHSMDRQKGEKFLKPLVQLSNTCKSFVECKLDPPPILHYASRCFPPQKEKTCSISSH